MTSKFTLGEMGVLDSCEKQKVCQRILQRLGELGIKYAITARRLHLENESILCKNQRPQKNPPKMR